MVVVQWVVVVVVVSTSFPCVVLDKPSRVVLAVLVMVMVERR